MVEFYSGQGRLFLRGAGQYFEEVGGEVSPASVTIDLLSSLHKAEPIAAARDRLITAYRKRVAGNLSDLRHATRCTIGTDPEVFVTVNGAVLPAWSFLPKRDVGVATYWDGFQGEFNVPHGGCLQVMVGQIKEKLTALWNTAKLKEKDAKLTLANTVELRASELALLPGEYVELGCKPSQNVYGLHGEDVIDPRKLLYRFAGGHIHLGSSRAAYKPELIKFLDRTFGVACVSLFRDIDTPIRRKYYGLPGEWRDKAYGVEYRSLSNAWLAHPAIAHLVLDSFRWATIMFDEELDEMLFPAGDEKEVARIICECDVDAAQGYLRKHRDNYYRMLRGTWGRGPWGESIQAACVRYGYDAFVGGMGAVVAKPMDMEKNWRLGNAWPITNQQVKGHSIPWPTQWSSAVSSLQLDTLI